VYSLRPQISKLIGGVLAPGILNFDVKTYCNIKKNGQKDNMYFSIFYVLTKSLHEKMTFFMSCVKR
jgi:hypothetical protein